MRTSWGRERTEEKESRVEREGKRRQLSERRNGEREKRMRSGRGKE